ncbi:ATP-binding protein [Yoonia sp. R2331]|uniref:PAS domain-containing hybrid sensor histidine kinase/response regulator n=1 Tax=Yoonia sp. R2331 TaxID=3237238 RepID=UPI0034E3A628
MLEAMSAEIRPVVRRLANSGLEQFAITADNQRLAVARTMTQLATVLASLIGALAFLVYYLNRMNNRAVVREREQKLTADRMNTVIGTSLDGVIVSNEEGKIIEFSPAAEAIFGHNHEDVLGKEIGDVIVPDHLRDAHDAGMERMRQGGQKRVVGKGRVTLEAKRANGEHFPVELAIQSAVTDEGEMFIAFLRDISKRVAAQEELVAARDKALAGEKLKTDFLATMSHEIRTPLNGLLGNMDLLRDTKLNSAQNRYMRNMETSGRLLMSHISDVLDITRYDAGKLNTRSEPVNVSALLQDIIDSQSSMAAANETTLDWGWEGDPLNWIKSDHDRLQHVLMNLIGNAVKFTKRGKVSLTAHSHRADDGHSITFEISDTGPGISPELADRIFDDFVTGNTAYDRDVGGTGLGLSIAKRFVSALNGKIWLESREGEGSNFFVDLPVTLADPGKEPSQDNVTTEVMGQLNVLLVEDNEINRVVAREMLELDGHKVTEAHDGQQGVHLAHVTKYDLILMDISMPIMDGRTATRSIREGNGQSAKSRIVALTANAMAEEQEDFIADGMDGILTKPLTKAALRQVLQSGHRQTPIDGVIIVDAKHAFETKDALGEEAYGKLLTRLAGEVDDLIDWLETAERPDRSDIASRAHKVAGSAAVFGAVALREHLKNIEAAAKAGEDSNVLNLIDELPNLWRTSKSAMS